MKKMIFSLAYMGAINAWALPVQVIKEITAASGETKKIVEVSCRGLGSSEIGGAKSDKEVTFQLESLTDKDDLFSTETNVDINAATDWIGHKVKIQIVMTAKDSYLELTYQTQKGLSLRRAALDETLSLSLSEASKNITCKILK